jgi:hypothetical protein
MKSVEVQLNEALAEIEQLKEAAARYRTSATYFERELRMTNAGLPSEIKDRLRRAFETSKDNAGLKEAINTEKRQYQNENSTFRNERRW